LLILVFIYLWNGYVECFFPVGMYHSAGWYMHVLFLSAVEIGFF
jgi:hypothetical protein